MIELTSHSSWTFMLKQHNAYVCKERDLSQRHAIYQKSVALAQLTLNQLQSNREGACFVHILQISPTSFLRGLIHHYFLPTLSAPISGCKWIYLTWHIAWENKKEINKGKITLTGEKGTAGNSECCQWVVQTREGLTLQWPLWREPPKCTDLVPDCLQACSIATQSNSYT